MEDKLITIYYEMGSHKIKFTEDIELNKFLLLSGEIGGIELISVLNKIKEKVNTILEEQIKHKNSFNKNVIDGNVHVIPVSGPKHYENLNCWCAPKLTADYTIDGGKKVYTHNETQ